MKTVAENVAVLISGKKYLILDLICVERKQSLRNKPTKPLPKEVLFSWGKESRVPAVFHVNRDVAAVLLLRAF